MSATDYLSETCEVDFDGAVGQNTFKFDSLRWKFASSGKMQRGDFYMAEAQGLLQRIFPMIDHLTQEPLWTTYARLVQTTRA
jgi:hypothetical protein